MQPEDKQSNFWNDAEHTLNGNELPPTNEAMEQTLFDHICYAGVDTSNLLSVKEIREKFNNTKINSTSPILASDSINRDQQRESSAVYTHGSERSQKYEDQVQKSFETIENREELTPRNITNVSSPHDNNSKLKQSSSEPIDIVEAGSRADQNSISEAKFLELVVTYKCGDAMKYFSKPRPIHVVLKRDEVAENFLIRQIMLMYHQQHRLLVMIKKSTARYIRLYDLIKLDIRKDCIDNLGIETDGLLQNMYPVVLYFTTSSIPMSIFFENSKEKQHFIELTIFLRNSLRSGLECEIIGQ